MDQQSATLVEFKKGRFHVKVHDPVGEVDGYDLFLKPEAVYAEDRRKLPIDGYVVFSSAPNTPGLYSFFETGWEHGEI